MRSMDLKPNPIYILDHNEKGYIIIYIRGNIRGNILTATFVNYIILVWEWTVVDT